MRRFIATFVVAATTVAMQTHAQYSWQLAFPNLPAFNYPVELVHAGDGTNRFFVAQQRGIIYVFNNTPNVSTRKVFLDISDRVSQSGGETGLLGLAFHPNYENNGYFYVNYTGGASLTTYIARYRVSATNPDSAVKQSELVLMTVAQPYSNHNGGKIAFGPDGYLYIGLGDGGSANDPGNRAQNRSVLLGKVLRINVDSTEGSLNYAIPPTNPYYRNQNGWREEIYAYGIRNPWRFSFDPVTHRLWLGDVGQDAREEVDIIISGGNYGWRLMEGFICNPTVNPQCQDTAGLLRPVWDYPNSGPDQSITGGYVYRGSAIPSLVGKYIYGDYGSGKTWALTYDGVNPPANQLLTDETYLVSTFGVDENNELYLCSYSSSAGRIYKLTGPPNGVHTDERPARYRLEQNYPNPFNPSTEIRYHLPEASHVLLKVFNILGHEVATLVNQMQEPGVKTIRFDANGLASGVYLYRLQAGQFTETRKMILAR
ncbi:MAG TPA: PQQ-dependent sugar dehydrogenase [Bacteroidota bacterium]|nr:PQQ-dependent sugar dehydrogenase [Bacteroidota bacterium]